MTDLAFLKGYQEDGAEFLAARTQAFLGDDMGVGKTSQVVRACDLVGAKRVLVFVPAGARVNWLNEFEKFSPLDRPAVALMDGNGRPLKSGVTVVSYDAIVKLSSQSTRTVLGKLAAKYRKEGKTVDAKALEKEAKTKAAEQRRRARERTKFRNALAAIEWDVLVLDEAHYLKERKAGRTRTIYGEKCDGQSGYAARAKRVWRLSGTPAPNNVSELWTHLHSAGLYEGNQDAFTHRYCTGFDSNYGFKITGVRNVDELKGLLDDFMLRRKKDNVVPELPPISFSQVAVSPTEFDPRLYFPNAILPAQHVRLVADVERQDNLLRESWRAATSGNAVTKLDAVDMIRNLAPSLQTLRRWIGLAKVPEYLKIVHTELADGVIDKLVVFAYNKEVLEELRNGLRDFGAVLLYGGTPAGKRAQRIAAFQDSPRTRVFVGQLQAAGTAINLTSACHIDVVQESYVPGENAQAVMRCHRIGQSRPVKVRFFGCKGSVDDDISAAHMRKTRELAKVIA